MFHNYGPTFRLFNCIPKFKIISICVSENFPELLGDIRELSKVTFENVPNSTLLK